MNEIIKADLYRYGGLSGTKGLIKGLRIPGCRYMYLLRQVASSKRFSIKWLFFSILKHKYDFKYSFQIDSKTEIGPGFYIGHYGAVVINPKARIGKNCNVAHGVTIGAANRGKRKGYPTIGNNVWIGTNAVIVGNVNIGSDVFIAPNSFVTVDVPDHSMVIGNPCTITHRENACEGYINFVS
ncbi:serine acetyltransferase [Mucilaginibacter sp. CAU 1740]|uniref:serine acetyltransferase n=1 Tax=Mucilaginibacter sp. CAU 1740 TaxID=3140365 RepID=UPI00325C1210